MALPDDPWNNLRKADPWAGQRQPTPQPQQIASADTGGGDGGLLSLLGGGGGGGGASQPRFGPGSGGGDNSDFLDMLGTLGSMMVMMDPQTQSAGTALAAMQAGRREERKDRRSQNETAQWLQSQGVGTGEAKFLTSHPTAMNAWYTAWKNGDKPDWHIEELYNDKGQKQKFMVDMKTGNLSPLGGSEIVKPKLSFQTSYDKDGNEIKVLVNEDDGTVVTQIGGAKSELLTPEEEAQKARIAAAGKPSTEVSVNTKGEGKQAEVIGQGFGEYFNSLMAAGRKAPQERGALAIMEAAVKAPGFNSGGDYGPFLLQTKQLAQNLGWNPEGVASMEAFNSQAKALVMAQLGTLGTGISTSDRQFIENMVPSLGISRGGNLAMIEIRKKQAERNEVLAQMAGDYAEAHEGRLNVGFDKQLAKWAKENPMFTPEEATRITTISLMPDANAGGGGGGGGEPAGATDDFVPVPGKPGVRVRRGTTGPADVAPVTPAPQPQPQPQPEPPAILPQTTQPRVRSLQPLPQPIPQRW